MAVELGPRVRVNAIDPAAIETPMLHAGFESSGDGLDQLASYHPAGKVGSVSELSRLIVSIAQSEGCFLHGSVIGFDGGIANVLHDPC
mgnify:CR=1 FL=1